jgi:hypothetical protein
MLLLAACCCPAAWDDVDAYYAGSSSAKRIPDVSIPLLCIQAQDDPIAPAEAIPYNAIAANPNCVLAVTPCGGHLGWAAGPGAPFGQPWSDGAVFEWLSSVHLELLKRKQQQNSGGDRHGEADVNWGPADSNGQSSTAPAAQQQQQPAVVAVNSSSNALTLEAHGFNNNNNYNNNNDKASVGPAADAQCVSAVANVSRQAPDCFSEAGLHQQHVMLQQGAGQVQVVGPAGPAADGVAIVRASDPGGSSVGKPPASTGSATPYTLASAPSAVVTQVAEDQERQRQQQCLPSQDSCPARAPARPQEQLDEYEVAQLLASQLRWAL